MQRRDFLKQGFLGAICCLHKASAQTGECAPKTNLILILADDLGFGDLGCYGNREIKTPHLDELARQGIKFNNFYAASSVCTPSRVSIMTGRYPLRYDVRGIFRDRNKHLPIGTETLPKLLADGGYFTAHIGKWHLGGLNIKHYKRRHKYPWGPLQMGFKHSLTGIEDHSIRAPLMRQGILYRDNGKHLLRNDEPAPPDNNHWTDICFNEALELIDECKRRSEPFYINLWPDAPHKPYEATPEPFMSLYEETSQGNEQLYRAMVTHLDYNVGRLVEHLKEKGLYQNTLLIFTSDNGPSSQGSAGSFSGWKGTLHEGGIRVPMIAVCPGMIEPGRESDFFCHTNDLLPTFCSIAKAKTPADLDGDSFLPVLRGRAQSSRKKPFFWQLDYKKYNHKKPRPFPKPQASAVARRGRWKLLAMKGNPVGLFDLENDPTETTNLLNQKPEIVRQLSGSLNDWLSAPRDKSWRR